MNTMTGISTTATTVNFVVVVVSVRQMRLVQQTWTRKVFHRVLRPCLWLKLWMVPLCRSVHRLSMPTELSALSSSQTLVHTVR